MASHGTHFLSAGGRVDLVTRPIFTVEVWSFRCLRCEHEWLPRKTMRASESLGPSSLPRVCPKCKSPYWDRERGTR